MNCNPATTSLVDPSNLYNPRAGEYNPSQLAQLATQISANQFEEITSKLNVAKFLNTFSNNLNRPILSNNNFNKLPNVFQSHPNGFNLMQTLITANNMLKIQNSPFSPAPPPNLPVNVNNPAIFNFNGNLPVSLNFNASAILEQIKSITKSNLKGTYFYQIALSLKQLNIF
jgi:hypothetical protein